MDREQEKLRARILELERQLEAKVRESSYYRRLAKAAGDLRLREAEGYSRLVAHLKEKIWLAETQHTALLDLQKEIERVGITDDLTQVLNRRSITERFQEMFETHRRSGDAADAQRRCFCALIDVDTLGKINESYGYRAGDELLRRFGALLRRSDRLSEADIIGRFAGKVFIIALPHRSEDKALEALERLLDQIARFRFRVVLDTKIQITASAGLSAICGQDGSVFDVIERADAALRRARAQGAGSLVYDAA